MAHANFENWQVSVHGLHRAALLLGTLQRLTQPPQPAYLELGLQVLPEGFAGGTLPAGGQAVLDLTRSCLVYIPRGETPVIFPLQGRSQSELFEDFFGTLAKGELAETLPSAGSLFERISQAIAAKSPRYRPPKKELLLNDEPLQLDRTSAREYLMAVDEVFTGIARFLARLAERKTPLVIWPEGFDLSTLVFVGNRIEERQPHLNFGFAPYEAEIDSTYLYAYASPYPVHFDPPVLPEGARWNTRGWTGVVLPYEVIAAQPDRISYVDACCRLIYPGLRSLISG